MLRGVLAASAALLCCAPAEAGMVTIKWQGTVEQQLNPGIDPLMAVGDVLTVTFRFDPATQATDGGRYAFFHDTTDDEFSVRTDRGLIWRAADDVNDETQLTYEPGQTPFWSGQYLRIDASDSPLLTITAGQTGEFWIGSGEGYYGNYTQSLGFHGTLALVIVTAVPEPTAWGLMLVGFGAAGIRLRGARSGSRQAMPT